MGKYPTIGVMVRSGVIIYGSALLNVLSIETIAGQKYINYVLLPHNGLFHGAVGDKLVFMDGNATFIQTVGVFQEHIHPIGWSARSPDLVLIEDVWDVLEGNLSGR